MITKSVIPAAGLGTRFLPLTKSIPKEMIPVLQYPALHYIIQEGLESGITDFTIITNDNKEEIQDYFSSSPLLEESLKYKNKGTLLKTTNSLINQATFTYVPQPNPKGLGHAISLAQDEIGDAFFGIFLPDDLFFHSSMPAMKQLVSIAEKHQASVIGVMEVPQERISSYGVIAYNKEIEPNVWELTDLVEKPAAQDAPSNLAISGRYVLSPKIFVSLAQTKPRALGEIQLTDAIAHMLKNGERVLACKIDGTRHDLGNPLGWLKANIDLALCNPEYAKEIQDLIASHKN